MPATPSQAIGRMSARAIRSRRGENAASAPISSSADTAERNSASRVGDIPSSSRYRESTPFRAEHVADSAVRM